MAAKVTLRPRHARQNQENPEKMFTRFDSDPQFERVKAFANSIHQHLTRTGNPNTPLSVR
jgi:hypothetical protein